MRSILCCSQEAMCVSKRSMGQQEVDTLQRHAKHGLTCSLPMDAVLQSSWKVTVGARK